MPTLFRAQGAAGHGPALSSRLPHPLTQALSILAHSAKLRVVASGLYDQPPPSAGLDMTMQDSHGRSHWKTPMRPSGVSKSPFTSSASSGSGSPALSPNTKRAARLLTRISGCKLIDHLKELAETIVVPGARYVVEPQDRDLAIVAQEFPYLAVIKVVVLVVVANQVVGVRPVARRIVPAELETVAVNGIRQFPADIPLEWGVGDVDSPSTPCASWRTHRGAWCKDDVFHPRLLGGPNDPICVKFHRVEAFVVLVIFGVRNPGMAGMIVRMAHSVPADLHAAHAGWPPVECQAFLQTKRHLHVLEASGLVFQG